MQDLEKKWKDFLKKYYWDEIIGLSNSYPENHSLFVKFSDLDIYDKNIADMLLEDPDRIIESATRVLRQMDISTGVTLDEAHFRIIKLPRRVKIRDIRSNEIGKLVSIEGLVTEVKEVRLRIVEAVFKCPFCGHIFSVEQGGSQFKEPLECEEESGGCGKTTKHFDLLRDHSKFVDTQRIRLEELPEELNPEESLQAIDVNLEDDLSGGVSYDNRVIVSGILRSYQKKRKTPFFDFCLDGNSIELKEEEFEGMGKARVRSIREIIKELEKEYGDEVPIEEVLDLAEEEGMGREKAEDIIETMKHDGIVFSLGSGHLGFVK